jgi:hypothetical protein
MAREDWRDRDEERRLRLDPQRDDFGQADYSTDYGYDPRRRTGYRAEEELRRDDDYGQADYSNDWAFDRERGRPYRRFSEEDRGYARRMDEGEYRRDRRRDEDDDPSAREAYRDDRHGDDRYRDERRSEREQPRSWMDRAGEFFAGTSSRPEERRRRGPSDRVLWAVIVERLEDERRLDLRDVDVVVQDGEVTLNGTVRRKEDRRRIEDIADIDGVRHVQNNLRVRERGWTFL